MRQALFSLLLLLTLTGCSWLMDLDAFPAGYRYYQEPFKAQPAKYAPGVGYPFSPERNDVVLEKWQAVAASLVNRLGPELNLHPLPIYVEMLPKDNAFNYTFDFVLRKELRGRGYTLVNEPEHSLHLRPEAYRPKDESVSFEIGSYNDEPDPMAKPLQPEKAERFLISLALVRDDNVLGKVDDMFVLPAYGYVPGEGQQRRKNHVLPEDVDGTASPVTTAPQGSAAGMPQQLVPEPVQSEIIGGPQ